MEQPTATPMQACYGHIQGMRTYVTIVLMIPKENQRAGERPSKNPHLPPGGGAKTSSSKIDFSRMDLRNSRIYCCRDTAAAAPSPPHATEH